LFIGFVALLTTSRRAVASDGQELAGASACLENGADLEGEIDYRKIRLFFFLKKYNSPLSRFAPDFVEAADLWQVDWRLLPAIAGLESYFGKRMVPGTFNAYGWGGGYIKFSSWRGSIFHLNYKLRKNYYNRGLISSQMIGKVYAPPNPNWGNLVASIMKKI